MPFPTYDFRCPMCRREMRILGRRFCTASCERSFNAIVRSDGRDAAERLVSVRVVASAAANPRARSCDRTGK